MSRLRIYAEGQPAAPLHSLSEPEAIANALAQVGVLYQRWPVDESIMPGADPAACRRRGAAGGRVRPRRGRRRGVDLP